MLWDDQLKGFGVRIYNSGKRSFIIQVRDRSKKQFKRTIGSIRARVIDKFIVKEYDGENIEELARKYKFDDSEYLEKCIKAIIQKNNISIIDKETYEERKEKNKQKK